MTPARRIPRMPLGEMRRFLLVVALLLVSAGCQASPEPAAVETEAPSPEPSPTDIVTEEPSPEAPDPVTVPDVVGTKLPVARNALRDVGLGVDTRRKASPEQPGMVLRQRPLGGLEVRPGRTVTLIVAKPQPPPPEPAMTCHSSYTGACLDPNATDYDCAGGSGDGPKYTGTVTVVGPDEYGLDSDGDGVGCE